MKWLAVQLMMFAAVLAGTDTESDTLSAHRVFLLGVVEVRADRDGDRLPLNVAAVDADEMKVQQRVDISKALSLLPGVTLSNGGSRNEAMILVRGFDLRQVPVFFDGFPSAIPFDGYVDLARFAVFNLGRIEVTKGAASVLYGPNAMGGAINIVSRAPVRPFEMGIVAGAISGGFVASARVATRQEKYYLQTSGSVLDQDYFPLPAGFAATVTEDGGHRDNSFRRDRDLMFRAGYTPKPGEEYVLTYTALASTKGNPVYAGRDVRITPRYWRWPYWNRNTLFFNIATPLLQNDVKITLISRLHFDRYRNALYGYDDDTYTTQLTPRSFRTFYDDAAVGANVECEVLSYGAHSLRGAVHLVQERHEEHNGVEPVRTFRDLTLSFALEDRFLASDALTITTGIGVTRRRSREADDYNALTASIAPFPANSAGSLDVQMVAEQSMPPKGVASLSVGLKHRLPTMKDRYSYRLGVVMPNPALLPERALNISIGYGGQALGHCMLRGELFHSWMENVIQRVDFVRGSAGQFRNTGRGRIYGAEAGIGSAIGSFEWDGAYTLLVRENRSNPSVKLTDTPRHHVAARVRWAPYDAWAVSIDGEYNSARFSTTDGVEAGAFAVVNAVVSCTLGAVVTVQGGMNNVLDRSYALVEGFPEPGRTFFLLLRIL